MSRFTRVPRLIGAALVAVPALLSAQNGALPMKLAPRPTTGPITVADLMTRLYRVADDSMGGRPTGSEGHVKVTQYIADELRRLGLRPAGDNGTYFQDIGMERRGFSATSAVSVGSRSFQIGDDFVPILARGGRARASTAADIVIGGTHGDSTTWISAEAARGKLVVMRPNPRRLQLDQRFMAFGPGSRFADAAAVVLPVLPQLAAPARRQLAQPSLVMGGGARMGAEVPPTLLASPEMAQALMGAAGQSATLALRFEVTPAPGRNVIAVLSGRDPALRGQYVALGAHTDHDPLVPYGVDHDSLRAFNLARERMLRELGERRATPQQLANIRVDVVAARGGRPARTDSIKNGADDDGSGTVTLLELAEAFATAPQKPRRSLLFVFHVAEEIGLLGADYFTEHPTVPLDSVVAQLNMDMVGRGGVDDIAGGGPGYLQLVGSRRLSRELGDLVEEVNRRQPQPFTFDYGFDADGHPERIYCRSDHAMYARYGVPVTFFHTGLHHDYHQVTDEPQYIDYEKMARIATLIHDVTLELGNRAERPKLDGPKPDPNAACKQ
ncbi:M20/M25/M40 family metallo-hydrolase [Pseudogemmatithrix spongiicola]|uniref:M20/M25/M40 family metallo-hydrolase n=1 Tax=Pseudogemmatithrix spongiicola TaxID=3062599 RepID=A0AA49Q7D6_9BACT|nr:M20/M25/M40 family metallo-hydrolase [Gemmatimonadaceae bacterium 'strain 138']WKW14579.1 M20/M25/M40 family metallo-hydrolase [Gemmatimonadaceae bacterium 'strain 318']